MAVPQTTMTVNNAVDGMLSISLRYDFKSGGSMAFECQVEQVADESLEQLSNRVLRRMHKLIAGLLSPAPD